MIRIVAIMALLGLAAAATLTKKEGYGGSNYSPGASYGGSSAGSYEAPTYTNTDSTYNVATGGAASYGGGSSTYGSGGSSYGSETSSSSGSGDSYGNLYYYYYPVTNHSAPSGSYGHGGGNYGGGSNYGNNAVGSYGSGGSGGSYGSGGSGGSYGSGGGGGSYSSGGSYGSGGGGYYPPAPYGSNDPFGGLLSVFSTIDINSLILPALLIGGVALLLPALLNCDLQLGTCVIPLPNLGGGRVARRSSRDINGYTMEEITISQMIDHASRIYEAVQEGEQCMQRVVCEVGGMMRNVKGKEVFFSVLDHFASQSYKKQLDVLKRGALPSLEKELTCEAFSCGKIDNSVE